MLLYVKTTGISSLKFRQTGPYVGWKFGIMNW